MKNLLSGALAAALLTVAAGAGETYAPASKNVVPPVIVYGTGWYFGLQAGINAYQDFGGTRHLQLGNNDIALEPKEKIGFAGGVKFGYVFGTKSVRPAIEMDVFYNGVQGDLDLRVNGKSRDFNADANLHSVGFLANFIVRFGTDRFQPYLGAGAGGYYGEVDDVDVTIGNRHFQGSGGSNSGFAWQLIGGVDYYLSEKTSVFGEYKFLNYEDAGISESRLSQHLVMLGVRWHF
jgi:opacity protein-like surface antigen